MTGNPGPLHATSYTPPNAGNPPVLVFYHGALGNFSVYLHFLRRWAEPRGWKIVLPSNGFGRWYTPEGRERAVASFDQATRGAERVIVMGMSNGATAAMEVAALRGSRVDGLVLVCPVLLSDQIAQPGFWEWAKAHPPVVLAGTEDVNVPPESVKEGVALMRFEELEPDFHLLPGHDHHILFSAEEELYSLLDRLVEHSPGKTSRSLQ